MVGIAPFEGQPLFSADKIEVSVNPWVLLRSNGIDFKSILLDQAKINLLVNNDGAANWDITKETEGAEASADSGMEFNFQLIQLKNAELNYVDEISDLVVAIEGLNSKNTGDFAQSIFEHSRGESLNITLHCSRCNLIRAFISLNL